MVVSANPSVESHDSSVGVGTHHTPYLGLPDTNYCDKSGRRPSFVLLKHIPSPAGVDLCDVKESAANYPGIAECLQRHREYRLIPFDDAHGYKRQTHFLRAVEYYLLSYGVKDLVFQGSYAKWILNYPIKTHVPRDIDLHGVVETKEATNYIAFQQHCLILLSEALKLDIDELRKKSQCIPIDSHTFMFRVDGIFELSTCHRPIDLVLFNRSKLPHEENYCLANHLKLMATESEAIKSTDVSSLYWLSPATEKQLQAHKTSIFFATSETFLANFLRMINEICDGKINTVLNSLDLYQQYCESHISDSQSHILERGLGKLEKHLKIHPSSEKTIQERLIDSLSIIRLPLADTLQLGFNILLDIQSQEDSYVARQLFLNAFNSALQTRSRIPEEKQSLFEAFYWLEQQFVMAMAVNDRYRLHCLLDFTLCLVTLMLNFIGLAEDCIRKYAMKYADDYHHYLSQNIPQIEDTIKETLIQCFRNGEIDHAQQRLLLWLSLSLDPEREINQELAISDLIDLFKNGCSAEKKAVVNYIKRMPNDWKQAWHQQLLFFESESITTDKAQEKIQKKVQGYALLLFATVTDFAEAYFSTITEQYIQSGGSAHVINFVARGVIQHLAKPNSDWIQLIDLLRLNMDNPISDKRKLTEYERIQVVLDRILKIGNRQIHTIASWLEFWIACLKSKRIDDSQRARILAMILLPIDRYMQLKQRPLDVEEAKSLRNDIDQIKLHMPVLKKFLSLVRYEVMSCSLFVAENESYWLVFSKEQVREISKETVRNWIVSGGFDPLSLFKEKAFHTKKVLNAHIKKTIIRFLCELLISNDSGVKAAINNKFCLASRGVLAIDPEHYLLPYHEIDLPIKTLSDQEIADIFKWSWEAFSNASDKILSADDLTEPFFFYRNMVQYLSTEDIQLYLNRAGKQRHFVYLVYYHLVQAHQASQELNEDLVRLIMNADLSEFKNMPDYNDLIQACLIQYPDLRKKLNIAEHLPTSDYALKDLKKQLDHYDHLNDVIRRFPDAIRSLPDTEKIELYLYADEQRKMDLKKEAIHFIRNSHTPAQMLSDLIRRKPELLSDWIDLLTKTEASQIIELYQNDQKLFSKELSYKVMALWVMFFNKSMDQRAPITLLIFWYEQMCSYYQHVSSLDNTDYLKKIWSALMWISDILMSYSLDNSREDMKTLADSPLLGIAQVAQLKSLLQELESCSDSQGISADRVRHINDRLKAYKVLEMLNRMEDKVKVSIKDFQAEMRHVIDQILVRVLDLRMPKDLPLSNELLSMALIMRETSDGEQIGKLPECFDLVDTLHLIRLSLESTLTLDSDKNPLDRLPVIKQYHKSASVNQAFANYQQSASDSVLKERIHLPNSHLYTQYMRYISEIEASEKSLALFLKCISHERLFSLFGFFSFSRDFFNQANSNKGKPVGIAKVFMDEIHNRLIKPFKTGKMKSGKLSSAQTQFIEKLRLGVIYPHPAFSLRLLDSESQFLKRFSVLPAHAEFSPLEMQAFFALILASRQAAEPIAFNPVNMFDLSTRTTHGELRTRKSEPSIFYFLKSDPLFALVKAQFGSMTLSADERTVQLPELFLFLRSNLIGQPVAKSLLMQSFLSNDVSKQASIAQLLLVDTIYRLKKSTLDIMHMIDQAFGVVRTDTSGFSKCVQSSLMHLLEFPFLEILKDDSLIFIKLWLRAYPQHPASVAISKRLDMWLDSSSLSDTDQQSIKELSIFSQYFIHPHIAKTIASNLEPISKLMKIDDKERQASEASIKQFKQLLSSFFMIQDSDCQAAFEGFSWIKASLAEVWIEVLQSSNMSHQFQNEVSALSSYSVKMNTSALIEYLKNVFGNMLRLGLNTIAVIGLLNVLQFLIQCFFSPQSPYRMDRSNV